MYESDIYVITRLTLLRPLSLLMFVMLFFSFGAIYRKKAQKGLMFLGLCFMVFAVKICLSIFAIGHALGTQGIGRNEAIIQNLWLTGGDVLFFCTLMLSGFIWFFVRNGIGQYKACWPVVAGLSILLFATIFLFIFGG